MSNEFGELYYLWKKNQSQSIFMGHLKEYECPCKFDSCNMQKIAVPLVQKLAKIRTKMKKPLKVTNGYRCAAYQEDLRKRGYETSVGPSQHELGRAADIVCPGATAYDFAAMLSYCEEEFKSIGEGLSFLHVDLRDDKPKRRWYYGIRK